MDKSFAFLLGAIGLVYSEYGSGDWLRGYVLPMVIVLSLLYLFWLKGFLIIAVGATAFYCMDLSSDSLFQGLMLPLLLGFCFIYFIWWLGVTFALKDSGGSIVDTGDDVGGFGGDGGGD